MMANGAQARRARASGASSQSAARSAPSRRSAAEPRLRARAALIYLRGSDQRQQEIAQALSDLAEAEVMRRGERSESQSARKASGTYRARGGRNTPERPGGVATDGL
jgi:hypothetical protein